MWIHLASSTRNGQLQTKAALDHETKASYSVTVTATDGDNLSDTTTVTITVTNVNEAPSFTEGSSATRAIAENTASDTNIGTAVAATDPDANDHIDLHPRWHGRRILWY